MRELLIGFFVTLGALAYAFIAEAPGALEGPNVPDGGFLAVAFHNCQPQPPGSTPPPDFTRSLAFIVAPQTVAGKGFIAVTACQYHNSDALPALPPGRYEVAGSQCTPDLAAVATRNQITLVPYNGGGDGGCDEAGPLIPATTTTTTVQGLAPNVATLSVMRTAPTRKSRQKGIQFICRCLVDKAHHMDCKKQTKTSSDCAFLNH